MRLRRLLASGAAAIAGGVLCRRLVAGDITVDLRWRRERPLGPRSVEVGAPIETVFDVIADPYLKRTTRAMAEKLRVLEKGSDMVLAEHFTTVGPMRVVTLETVRFDRPHLVSFRLVRGPVPSVTETFSLASSGARATTLSYRGTLGTDGGRLGAVWGALVARRWEHAVAQSLDTIAHESERLAGSGSGEAPRAPSRGERGGSPE